MRISLAAIAAGVLLSGCGGMALRTPAAMANLSGSPGSQASGSIQFEQRGDRVLVDARISGLTPGPHGVHIHQKGNCTAANGSSAGPHFNPTADIHGGPADAHHHAGDLGNVVADASGVARLHLELAGIGLDAETTSVIGRSVLVGLRADDLVTQPDGGSGPPAACGLIGKSTDKWF